jgi:uncharacterized protein YmfQ (DUF2313 family)
MPDRVRQRTNDFDVLHFHILWQVADTVISARTPVSELAMMKEWERFAISPKQPIFTGAGRV